MQITDEFKKFLEVMKGLSSVTAGIEPKRQEIVQSLVGAKATHFPTKLYHYTGFQGVSGILHSNTLWATDFRFLNDSSELVYGASLLVEKLQSFANDGGGDISALLNKVANYYREHGHIYREFFETYVISLSEEPDMLSQWRAYADQARGYCMEFDLSDSRLFSIISSNTPWALEILPVIYDTTDQRRLIQEGIVKLINYLDSTDWPIERVVNASEMEQGAVLGLLMHAFEPFVTAFKYLGFSEEKEWRAITSCARNLTENCKKQIGAGNSTRYYIECIFIQGDEENLWQRKLLPVTNISLGPLTGDAEKENLQQIIRKNGYENLISVNKSKIPLKQ